MVIEEAGDDREGDTGSGSNSGLYIGADMEGQGASALPAPSTLVPGSPWMHLD